MVFSSLVFRLVIDFFETLKIMVEDGFSIKDGHPTFNKRYTDPINAQQFAQEMIKHNYRDGWKLVDMPK